MLYGRMTLLMAVSLYTSRVVLNALGVEDFGVYSVVTGFVITFGFLNSAMNASVQRFLTVEFNNHTSLNKVFNMSVLIHLVLALLMVFFAELIGLYLLYDKFVIPSGRMTAAVWIFHLSVLSLFFNIMNVPYRALIITHENMGTFAFISIFEVFAKLGVAIFLGVVLLDRLIFYGLLLTIVSVLVQIFYMIYCINRYKQEVCFKPIWDKSLFTCMCGFAGWNLFGVFAGIAYNQGVNIVLNIFGGPIINAARAIAFQVSGAANQLATNFQMAVNPPIMKSYVANDGNTEKLIYSSSKVSAILLLLVSIPTIIEAPYMLKLWLKTVPDYAINLTRLALIDAVICSMAGPLHTLFQARGQIKIYQSIVSCILLLNLPISYGLLKLGLCYEFTFVVSITLSIFALIARLLLVRNFTTITFFSFTKAVIIPTIFIVLLSSASIIPVFLYIHNCVIRLSMTYLLTTIMILMTTMLFGMTKDEKQLVNVLLHKVLKK